VNNVSQTLRQPPRSYGIYISVIEGKSIGSFFILLFFIKETSKKKNPMSSSKGTVLVTGANGGLGSAIVTNLLQKPELASNYTGLYTVRKAASATRLQGILKQAPESHKNVLDMDLSSLASVRTAAAEINRRVAAGELPPIKVLILNAAYQDHEQIVSQAHIHAQGLEILTALDHDR
jgi:NAD(P)-dependent dehydrogenase (short-subunit alcohol dehydrogenase family)